MVMRQVRLEDAHALLALHLGLDEESDLVSRDNQTLIVAEAERRHQTARADRDGIQPEGDSPV